MAPSTQNAAPMNDRKPSVHIHLDSSRGGEVSLVRSGDDIFFVNPFGEVLAALVQTGHPQLNVAVV